MPEWLIRAAQSGQHLGADQLALRLAFALIFGGIVAVIYRVSHGREEGSSTTLFTTLVLLSALIAMVSIVIADSVARAFSLVGALSIVRFRTVVDDTRDTAFVIFAVIVGMAAGAGQLIVPMIALPLIGVTAIALSRSARPGSLRPPAPSTLSIRIALGLDPESVLRPVFDRHARSARLKSLATARQGAAIDLTYQVVLKPDSHLLPFLADLNRVDGVMQVEVRDAA
ncbi:MAG: DUF4956 domain-containing protein [Planctomyces sp.]|nr:DUF4956 domain-containing protein [Planctomyces sp.]